MVIGNLMDGFGTNIVFMKVIFIENFFSMVEIKIYWNT